MLHRPHPATHAPEKNASVALAASILLGLGACAGISTQGQNTAVGAGVGAIGGAILTGGSPAATVGGAVVGGVIGHEVGKTK